MKRLFSLSLIALVFASCQNTGDRKATPTAPTAPATTSLPAAPATVTTGTTNSTTATTTTNGTATAALNPEHGAPGHRCEIPVGAPLNGAASSAPATNSNIAPVTMQPQLPAMPAKGTNSTARLNPAHGAPGHNCAIPVGSPL